MNQSDVTTVLFDLDDTLCEYRRTTDEVLAVAFETVGIEPFFKAADWHAVIPKITAVDDRDFRLRCFTAIAEAQGYDPAHVESLAVAYGEERDHSDVRFLPGAEDTLTALADEYRLGLVTNGSRAMQRPKLAALGLTDAFDVTVYAGSDTPPKPDPSPFHRALNALESTPNEAIHVGNSLPSDVAGARAAGIRPVWIPSNGESTENDDAPTHTLSSLHELRTLPWFGSRPCSDTSAFHRTAR